MPMGLFLAIFVGFVFIFQAIIIPIVNAINEIRTRWRDKQNNKARILDEQIKKVEIDKRIRDLNILRRQIEFEYKYLCDKLPNTQDDSFRRCILYYHLLNCISIMQDDLRGIPMGYDDYRYILVNQINKSIYDPKSRDEILLALKHPPSTDEIFFNSWIEDKRRLHL